MLIPLAGRPSGVIFYLTPLQGINRMSADGV
jgi:hypothetical protein